MCSFRISRIINFCGNAARKRINYFSSNFIGNLIAYTMLVSIVYDFIFVACYYNFNVFNPCSVYCFIRQKFICCNLCCRRTKHTSILTFWCDSIFTLFVDNPSIKGIAFARWIYFWNINGLIDLQIIVCNNRVTRTGIVIKEINVSRRAVLFIHVNSLQKNCVDC